MTSWLALPIVLLLCICAAGDVLGFKLTILHTNDVHAHIDEFNRHNTDCTQEDRNNNRCFGGSARIKSKINQIKGEQDTRNVLVLDAGDQYQGSLMYYTFKGHVVQDFMDKVGYDAMCLGNHEFDDGVAGLNYLDKASFSVLSCNANFSQYPNYGFIKAYTVLRRGTERIGVIGYTTTETPAISHPEKVIFRPEIPAIQEAVDELKKQNVSIIIALGHSGYEMDKEIARSVSGIDVIVGGHSATFLYSGKNVPSDEVAEGPYPTVVESPAKEKVLIVQDYAYGKYLGRLDLDFDDDGLVESWSGNPILLDNSVAQDRSIISAMGPYNKNIQQHKVQVLGTSYVYLDGTRDTCRVKECNLGNMITDAMVNQIMAHNQAGVWASVGIAILNGGGIRASIAEGDITTAEMLTVLPFGQTIDGLQLSGQTILDILEYCASRRTTSGLLYGGFLQVSGMRITYDMRKPENERVVEVKVICTNCQTPEFRDIDKKLIYTVLMPSFLADGGDGYDVISNNTVKRVQYGMMDSTIALSYIQRYSPITTGLEGRIRFLDENNDPPKPSPEPCKCSASTLSASGLALVLFLTCWFLLH